MKSFNQHIVNCTALRQFSYVFRTTSFGQSTLMGDQYSFYSISVLHLIRLTISAYFIHWNHHLVSKARFLDWFQSYLTGRTQTVQIKKSTSEPHELKYGVSQGSVLGPILFTIYTTPLGQLIRRHGLTFHLYADDPKLYLAFKPSEPSSIVNNISRLEKCVDDIRPWMKLNLLKVNDDRTEILVITSRPSTSQSLHISIKVGDQDISPSEEPPKNLGVIFDSTCSLKDHVSNVCRSINFNLYSICKIRKYFDRPTVEKLVNATITSRLDYCNSLMFGIHKELISQLQYYSGKGGQPWGLWGCIGDKFAQNNEYL